MNDKFLFKVAEFLKAAREAENLGIEKPDWLILMPGPVEDHAMDFSQRLRIGPFCNNDRDPYTDEEAAELLRTRKMPTIWVDPLRKPNSKKLTKKESQ